jgi:hypothetical protein
MSGTKVNIFFSRTVMGCPVCDECCGVVMGYAPDYRPPRNCIHLKKIEDVADGYLYYFTEE